MIILCSLQVVERSICPKWEYSVTWFEMASECVALVRAGNERCTCYWCLFVCTLNKLLLVACICCAGFTRETYKTVRIEWRNLSKYCVKMTDGFGFLFLLIQSSNHIWRVSFIFSLYIESVKPNRHLKKRHHSRKPLT